MVKEFVLIERGEYDRLKDNPSSNENENDTDTTPGSSMLPQYLRGLILVKLLSMVFICLELMFMKC